MKRGFFLLVSFLLALTSAQAQVTGSANSAQPKQYVPYSKLGRLDPTATFDFSAAGFPQLENVIRNPQRSGASYFIQDPRGSRVELSVDPDLQLKAESLLQKFRVPYGALVAIEPKTGRVLAFSDYSAADPHGKNVATRATFPAASLFKIITAAAALEESDLQPHSLIRFSGSNHSMLKTNYAPSRRDRRSITFADALGKSCNPVFSRVALANLNRSALARYAQSFGFNSQLPFDIPVDRSRFSVENSDIEFARTAAGFGDAYLSPLHAAMIAAAVANQGKMMRPFIVDSVLDPNAQKTYHVVPSMLTRAVLPTTADNLVEMMKSTMTSGTGRRQFGRLNRTLFRDVTLAGKSGTLRGENPKGVYHWFVAFGPSEDAEIAVAALVIDPGTARIGGSALARYFLEYWGQRRHQQHSLQAADSGDSSRAG